MQTGFGDCHRHHISFTAITHSCSRTQTLRDRAAEGSLLVLLCILPLLVFAGCITPEETLLAEGEELLSRQENEGASLLFSRYIQLRPDAPLGYFKRGIAYRNLGRLQAAEADIAEAVLLSPANESFRWARVDVLQRRYENLQTFSGAPVERPAWETLKIALVTLMMQELDKILRLDPSDVAARLKHASLLILSGSLEEAMKELDRSVLEAPFDPDVRNERGKLLHETGRYSDALEDYDMALHYCDSCTVVKFNKGLSLMKCGRMEEAAATFQEVVTEDSLDAGAWFNLSEAQLLLGRKNQACVSLEKSMSLGLPEARDLYEELCR